MPKSKRNKQISLTRTKKNVLELKKRLIQEVQACVDRYANIFVFSVNDMRNTKLKEVRENWRHSRFFFGKNKVMSIALGRSPEEEYRTNLYMISSHIKGQCGLLFSNQSKEEVLSWFNSYSQSDFARSGNTATSDVSLPQGPLPQFPHSLEPYLRQLGMPTTLQKGIVHLTKDYEVCKEGELLTPETAKILKLLGNEMAEFRITVECAWSNDGSFTDFKAQGGEEEVLPEMQVDSASVLDEKDDGSQGSAQKKEKKEHHDLAGSNQSSDDPKHEANASSDNTAHALEELHLNSAEGNDDIAVEDKENIIKETEEPEQLSPGKLELLKRKTPSTEERSQNIKKVCMESSPDEKSPLFRNLRNRVVKVHRKKKGK